MAKYIRKATSIEAVRWTGDNVKEIKAFIPSELRHMEKKYLAVFIDHDDMYVSIGDMVVKDQYGDFSLCQHDIFQNEHNEVTED